MMEFSPNGLNDITYNPNTGLFYKAGSVMELTTKRGGSRRGGEYPSLRVGKKYYYAHRIAFFMMTGRWPTMIDHINGIKNDNRWCNLREASMSQNKANEGVRSSNTSGWKGVSFEKATGRWESYICSNGKKKRLGRWGCPTAAHLAYLRAAKIEYGEFARSR